MPFDLRIDFATNDLMLDTHNDLKIIDAENMLRQQIHNRLIISKNSYIHDKNLGSSFDEIFRMGGVDLNSAIDVAVRSALAPIQELEIADLRIDRRPARFTPENFRPRRARQLFTNSTLDANKDGYLAGQLNSIIWENKIYRGKNPGALRSTYTGKATPKSNLAYRGITYAKSVPSTSLVWLYVPASWDGGNTGIRLSMEGWGGEFTEANPLAVSKPADFNARGQFQQLRVSFTPPNTQLGNTVLRGWNGSTDPGDAPSVGSWLVTDEWETYNVDWDEIPEAPQEEVVVSIDYSFRVSDSFVEGAAEFPSDIRTTSFVL